MSARSVSVGARRPRKTLLLKLLVALVLPTVGVFSLFGYFAYELQREDLEAELGRRLQSVASAAATQRRRRRGREPLLRGRYAQARANAHSDRRRATLRL